MLGPSMRDDAGAGVVPPSSGSSSPEPSAGQPGEITALLRAWQAGDAGAMESLAPLVYDTLRAIARRHLGREREGHTLTPTALVHEAWLRLAGGMPTDLRDRVHFLALSSRVMRRVLVDHARRGLAGRRTPEVRPTLDLASASADEWAVTMIALNDALEQLAGEAPRLVRVVEMRFFGGLTEDEAADVLGVSRRTVHRDWLRVRAWLELALRD
jgi:RNA polymerase sigma factor (TIGR02999 family)